MELLVQRHHLSDPILAGALLIASTTSLWALALTSATVAHKHVELGNLVCVLARSGHLDRACPVEVAVAQGERKLLDVELR